MYRHISFMFGFKSRELTIIKISFSVDSIHVLFLNQIVAAMCSKVPFLSNAIMKATECGR
jgi:hypothetical protein